MSVDRAALDETMRRFPRILELFRRDLIAISAYEAYHIGLEYRLVCAERAKSKETN